jgi:hypothetical protein
MALLSSSSSVSQSFGPLFSRVGGMGAILILMCIVDLERIIDWIFHLQAFGSRRRSFIAEMKDSGSSLLRCGGLNAATSAERMKEIRKQKHC